MKRWKRREGLPHQTIDGETLIVVPKERLTHHLNASASFVWSLLADPRGFDELADLLEAEFEADRARIRADLKKVLAQMERKGILERAP